MKKNSTDNLEVKGSMTPEGADKAGMIQAYAKLIACSLGGIATVITAVAAVFFGLPN
jgi:hypothetical protein